MTHKEKEKKSLFVKISPMFEVTPCHRPFIVIFQTIEHLSKLADHHIL